MAKTKAKEAASNWEEPLPASPAPRSHKLQGSVAPTPKQRSLDQVKTLERECPSFDDQLAQIPAVLRDDSILAHHRSGATADSNQHGRAAWALRWALKKLRNDSHGHVRHCGQLWILIGNLIQTIPAATGSKILTDGGFLDSLIDSLPTHTGPRVGSSESPSHAEVTVNTSKKRKRAIDSVSAKESGKRKIRTLTSETGVAPISMAYAGTASNCLRILAHRAQQATQARDVLDEAHLASALRASGLQAARLLAGSIWSKLSEPALSLEPAMAVWNRRIASAAQSSDSTSTFFVTHALPAAVAFIARYQRDRAQTEDLRLLERLIAIHVVLPPKSHFVAGAVDQQGSHLYDMLRAMFESDDISPPTPVAYCSILYDICIKCARKKNGAFPPAERSWLESTFKIFGSLTGFVDSDSGGFRASAKQPLEAFESILQLVVDHKVPLSSQILGDIVTSFCDAKTAAVGHHQCRMAALVIRIDSGVFLPSQHQDNKAIIVLRELLKRVSGLLYADYRTRKPRSVSQAEDRPFDDLSNGGSASTTYEVVVSGILLPLLKAYTRAGQLATFLGLWRDGMQEAVDKRGSVVSAMSVWEDACLVNELKHCLELRLNASSIGNILEQATLSLQQSAQTRTNLLGHSAGQVVVANIILRTLRSADTVKSVLARITTLQKEALDALKNLSEGSTHDRPLLMSLLGSSHHHMAHTHLRDADAIDILCTIEQSFKAGAKHTDRSRPDPESERVQSATAFYWLDAVSIQMLNHEEETPDIAREKLQAAVKSAFASFAESESGKSLDLEEPEVHVEDAIRYLKLLLHVTDKAWRRRVLQGVLRGIHLHSGNNEALEPGLTSTFSQEIIGSGQLVDDLGHCLEQWHARKTTRPVLAHAPHHLLCSQLPTRLIPRRYREKLINQLILQDEDTGSAAFQFRLSLISKLMEEPFGRAEVASNVWIFLSAMHGARSALEQEPRWKEAVSGIALCVVQDHPQQPPAPSKTLAQYWDAFFRVQTGTPSDNDATNAIRQALGLPQFEVVVATPEDLLDKAAVTSIHRSTVHSLDRFRERLATRAQIVSMATRLDEASRARFLSDCVQSHYAGLVTAGRLDCLEAIFSDAEASRIWATLPGVSSVVLMLCRCISSISSDQASTFDSASKTLISILQQPVVHSTQRVVEAVLGAACSLTSASAPDPGRAAASLVFSRVASMIRSLLMSERRHLNGRYHLLVPALQGLLRSLFVPDANMAADARLQLPPWAMELADGNDMGHHVPVTKHADELTRLLTLTAEPSASAARSRQREDASLVDEIAKAKDDAGKHVVYLIQTWAECSLSGRLPEGAGVREALMPGVWSVLGCVKGDVLQAMADGMRSDARAVLTALLAEWRRATGGRGV